MREGDSHLLPGYSVLQDVFSCSSRAVCFHRFDSVICHMGVADSQMEKNGSCGAANNVLPLET